jgi:hypothetical protein
LCPGVAVCVAGRGGGKLVGGKAGQAGEFTDSEQLSLVLAWLVGAGGEQGVVCRR